MSDTEPALLDCGKVDDVQVGLRIFDVPRHAARYVVPDRDDVPESLRGVEFDRAGYHDGSFQLPVFRRRSRRV